MSSANETTKPAPVLCLMGTSRLDGNTHYLTEALLSKIHPAKLIDIGTHNIAPYRYSQDYPEDDTFTEIVQEIDTAERIIFSTPVYWYAMSAQLKIVFDRLTDLTEMHKSVGKRLSGKTAFALICNGNNADYGESNNLPEGFLVPFIGTADYFNMKWGGALSISAQKNVPFTVREEEQLQAFAATISLSGI